MTLELDNFTIVADKKSSLFAPITVTVAAGAPLAVMGHSGIGKSMLIAAIGGFLPNGFSHSGACRLNGEDILVKRPEARQVGIMFQEPLLFPHLSVGQNLGFALPSDNRDRKRTIEIALAQAGLEGFAPRMPHTLSGGQRSRVALLRALLARPQAFLLDEAFANLDQFRREALRAFTFERTKDIPVIMVTHDAQDADAAHDKITLKALGD